MHSIDMKLQSQMKDLESIVMQMRDQIKSMFTTRLPMSLYYIQYYITPLTYNWSTHPWEHVIKHIQDVMHSNITID